MIILRLMHPLIRQLESAVDDLEKAQHTASLGSWHWHIPSGEEVWSDEQFRIFGYEPNEIAPSYEAFRLAVHPDDRNRVEEAVEGAIDVFAPYKIEFRIIRRDGEVRHIEAQGTVHRDQAGHATSMTGTVLDVTARKRLETKTRQGERARRRVSQVSQAMIVALDAAGRVILVNRRVCEILGFDELELVGANWFETVIPEDSRAYLVELHRSIVDGVVTAVDHFEYGVITKAGERRFMTWHGAVTKNDEGAIVGYLISGVDVTSLKCAEETSRYMASHDALTGLPNRVLFRDRLEQAMAHAQREQTWVGLLYLDLNDFKPVNDNMGHAAGDLLLKAVAERLRQTLRTVDTVARMGGDEFTVILGGLTDQEAATVMVRKIADALAKPFTIDGEDLRIGASIGMAVYPTDETTIDKLLARADGRCMRTRSVTAQPAAGNLSCSLAPGIATWPMRYICRRNRRQSSFPRL